MKVMNCNAPLMNSGILGLKDVSEVSYIRKNLSENYVGKYKLFD